MFRELWANFVEFISHGQNVAFAILAVIMISAAVFMISFTRVVHMVVSMALVFLGLAGMYFLLEAEFVGVAQILVYGGGITILMIFGIMMTRHGQMEEEPSRPVFQSILLIGVFALFGIMFYAIQDTTFISSGTFNPGEDNTRAIGQLIYNNYVIPFELISVLLTVAFIGAIVMAKREEE